MRVRCFALAVISLLSGCSGAIKNVSPVTESLPLTGSVIDARLLSMADRRQPDLVLLDSLLSDESSDLVSRQRKAHAALLIGQLKVPAFYSRAAELLLDPDTAVAATAAFSLGLVADSSRVDALGRAVAGAPDAVAIEAAWALGKIGEPARRWILAGLGFEEDSFASKPLERSAAVKSALLLAAANLRPVPVKAVVAFLNDENSRVVWSATYAIARTRSSAGVRNVLALNRHPDPTVRVNVALAGIMAAAGDSLSEVAIPILQEMLKDSDFKVRVQAVRSIASYSAVQSSKEQLMSLTTDESTAVRVTIAEVLSADTSLSEHEFRELYGKDTSFAYQRVLMQAGIKRGFLLNELPSWRNSTDEWKRVFALDMDRAHPDSASLKSRTDWVMSDASPMVRAAGIGLLVDRSDIDGSKIRLKAQISDRSPLLRSAALNAYSGFASADDIPLAIERYLQDSSRSSHAARQAALRLIASIWRRDSSEISVAHKQRLAALSAPDDLGLRRIVVGVTPLTHWQSSKIPEDTLLYRRVAADWRTPVRGVLRTSKGEIEIRFNRYEAPLTVENFVSLAKQGYFNGIRFHRVIANFVVQGGDASGTGSGGAGTTIRDELNRLRYDRGAVGMALSGPDTGGSQFYLTILPQPHLDGGYTVFGQIIRGFKVMDLLLHGDTILSVDIL